MAIKDKFAPDFERNSEGLVLFPRDDKYRKELWPNFDITLHPAKANIYLVTECIRYVSEVGETVMDIMSGTGTIMVGALLGRRVICIEIGDLFQGIIQQNILDLEKREPGSGSMVTLIPGDCNLVLPIPADHIIFSPPYSSILKATHRSQFDRDTKSMMGVLNYSHNANQGVNVGELSDFLFHQQMDKIYRKCYQSLPVGGTITIIVKDHIVGGQRVSLSLKTKQQCEAIGFEPIAWHRWLPPGFSYVGIRKARGEEVVLEEEIIVLRRPK